MVRLLGRPVMEHIVGLLRENNISDICVTLKHLPENIISYFGDGTPFGVHIEYRVEDDPLGTAGSVRACMDFIGEDDFLVISGDAACDFDLQMLIKEHRIHNSPVTIALYPQKEPLEYGLVLTDPDGAVISFIEKPDWSEFVTDLVNSGIYIYLSQYHASFARGPSV
jgi:mannose-1-phosphate guanylyltransferase/phosphomannomutase